MRVYRILAAVTVLFSCVAAACAAGTLTDNIRISSQRLGYDLQYRVYMPETRTSDARLPTLYITDGQWYLEEGRMVQVLDREIAAGRIAPLIAVFVDSRDPDRPEDLRRNKEFSCNSTYAEFYLNELIPRIALTYPASNRREDRTILGLSFGGLNSACFGLMAYSAFSGIAMQSPANDEHVDLMTKLYKQADLKPIRIFMSVGRKNDNTAAGRRFKRALVRKGYDVTYKEVNEGHSWNNWRPLLDDVLHRFYATPEKMESR